MRVVKVLNNSLILALDNKGKETILMGKGIGFNKSIGHKLQKEDIEKVFVLKDKSTLKGVIQLAAEVEPSYFEIAKGSIDYARTTYGMELMDHLYLGLTSHLSFAVKRMQDGIFLHNFYTSHIKQFNKQEYDVAVYTMQLLEKTLGITLPDDEAGNIAFHFINAGKNNPYADNNLLMMEIVEGILGIVKYTFGIKYIKETLAYTRFLNHLRLFVIRLLNNELFAEGEEDLLFSQIIGTCEKEYKCVEKIGIYIKEKMNQNISEQEALYLTIHIHRILQEYKE